jgi:hypothetical protein
MKNIKKIPAPIKIVPIIVLTLSFLGCSSQGDFRGQRTETGVSLAENNYKIIKAGARGESQGFNLLFLPLISPNYADAKANLYADVGDSLVGRSVALANQTEDVSSLNLIVFSIPKVTITADVIEFTSRSQSPPLKNTNGR